ncbi:MAG: hypothetical protein LBJ47_06830 [Tannerella sp.]|nr:hypothetical protein [Tannerella sp.]
MICFYPRFPRRRVPVKDATLRHCERSEAISTQAALPGWLPGSGRRLRLDCFVPRNDGVRADVFIRACR